MQEPQICHFDQWNLIIRPKLLYKTCKIYTFPLGSGPGPNLDSISETIKKPDSGEWRIPYLQVPVWHLDQSHSNFNSHCPLWSQMITVHKYIFNKAELSKIHLNPFI